METIVFQLTDYLTFHDSVQQKDLRLIITLNPAEYISVNRRIYDHLEGMIPATTKKLLDMPNCAATVPHFSYC